MKVFNSSLKLIISINKIYLFETLSCLNIDGKKKASKQYHLKKILKNIFFLISSKNLQGDFVERICVIEARNYLFFCVYRFDSI